eukprot:545061-Pyramimonas_sp.AAC.1
MYCKVKSGGRRAAIVHLVCTASLVCARTDASGELSESGGRAARHNAFVLFIYLLGIVIRRSAAARPSGESVTYLLCRCRDRAGGAGGVA